MKSFYKKSLLIIFITLILIEFFSFLSIKFNLVSGNLPSWVITHAHKEFSHWHPKNIHLKIYLHNVGSAPLVIIIME